jgi:HAE1 family hydrophobic/amphiphilic exporter-1
MNLLAAICVKRPVFATVLILVFTVFGVFGYFSLGVDRFPKIDFPTITVTTRLPGAAPEEVETEITEKVEEAVNTVSGIDELRSVSAEGISMVFVTFELEKDIDSAAQDVRDKVNRIIPDLPRDIDQPTVEKIDPDAIPVMQIAVRADLPIREITEYCDKTLRRQLESIAGVGQVVLVGGQKRQINVELAPLKLREQSLTVADVGRALAAQNLQVPGGSLKVGAKEFTLRTLGRVGAVEELESIALANRDGRTITVGDVGRVEDSTEELKSVSFYNETPTVQLQVRKQSGTNTVQVVHRVKERLEELRKIAPKQYQIEVVRDQSIFIEASAHAVMEHLVLGSILAAIVVLFFLADVRATIIAAISIPTSIISAFAIINYMGFTLNSITLLALTLSVGIVIDDAIVVMENIFRYIEEKGYDPYDAAIAATSEIGLAVLAITLSLVAVFLPIAFMGGIVGQFLKSFGITMSATIMVSMLVSFTLTPMLAARWFRKKIRSEGEEKPDAHAAHAGQHAAGQHAAGQSKSRGIYRVIEQGYLVMLTFSLRHRWIVVVAMLGALFSVPVLMKTVRGAFLPEDDQSEFLVNVQTPEGTSLEATQVLVQRIAREVRGGNGVMYTLSTVGEGEQQDPTKGGVYVKLVNIAERSFDQLAIMDEVRKKILPKYLADFELERQEEAANLTGEQRDRVLQQKLKLTVTPAPLFSGGGMAASDIQFMIGGPDMKQLGEYSEHVMAALREVPGAVDVQSSLTLGKPQYGVTVDRAKAAQLGVSIADIANTLRLLVAGDKVSDYNESGEQYEIHVRALAAFRNDINELAMISVPSSKFGTVQLGDVVQFPEGTGPAQVDRLKRTRQVTITANMAPGADQQKIQDAISAAAVGLNMGPDYLTGFMGKSKEMARAMRGFLLVFIMAFIFVYLVIAAQFESWLHPITILLSLPLTLPFALASLLIFDESLNIFSILGILVLFAVVKKNSILQIDHTNQLREAGMPRNEAIIAANLDRLRPILMTTIAFVAGMIPLFVSNAEGAATNRAISGVVIGGQTLSLLLTLLATPVAYSLFDDLANARLVRWILRSKSPAIAPPAMPVVQPAPAIAASETFVGHALEPTVIVAAGNGRAEPSNAPSDASDEMRATAER